MNFIRGMNPGTSIKVETKRKFEVLPEDEVTVMSDSELNARKRTSEIWGPIQRLDSGKRRCTHCGKEFSAKTSTWSLRSHMERFHTKEWEERDKSPVVDKFSAAKADDLLVKMIVTNCLALIFVDSQTFKDFIKYLNPSYKPPGRTKLSDTMLAELREKVEGNMKKAMTDIKSFSLTLDSWTSTGNKSFITVTAHGINKEWKLKSFVLDFMYVKQSETGEYIADSVSEILDKWGIPLEKISCITSDSAANMKNAFLEQMQMPWLACIAHVLNLVVRKGLESPEVKSIIKKAKAISKHFRRSPLSKRILSEKQKALNLPVITLKVDTKTRWNSCYYMIKQLIKSREAVSASIACINSENRSRRNIPQDLGSIEWSLLKEIMEVLRPFKDTSELVSGQKYATISFYMPSIDRLQLHFLSNNTSDSEAITQMKNVMINEFSARFTGTAFSDMSDSIILSVYMDPRFKNFNFIEDETERKDMISKAEAACKKWLDVPDNQVLSQMSPCIRFNIGSDSQSNDTDASQDCFVEKKYFKVFGRSNYETQDNCSAANEIEKYSSKIQNRSPSQNSDMNKMSINPLKWWKTKRHKYPRLSKLAKRVLCISATSTPSERVFSSSGWIMNKRRTLTGNNKLSNLVFLCCNNIYSNT